MSLVFAHTLTRLRPTRTDDGHGNFESDWTGADELPIPGWALDAGNTVEDLKNRDGSLVAYTARGPYAADVESGDRMSWHGETFEVEGAVMRQPGPTSRTSHTILLLTRWDG